MTAELPHYSTVSCLPAPGDNVAIAVRTLEAGTILSHPNGQFTLPFTVLEGHRFVVEPIPRDTWLLSWGLPFGRALRDLQPGEYACNSGILDALRSRHVPFPLPGEANFVNQRIPFALDPATFIPGKQVELADRIAEFQGFDRGPERGVGTRNCIVVLAVNSQASGLARAVAEPFKTAASPSSGLDGVVAVAHTEGDTDAMGNNHEYTLRTLAGFMVHPNVAAVLAIDYGGGGSITAARLQQYLRGHGYPIERIPHRFYAVQKDYATALRECIRWIEGQLPACAAMRRSPQPLARLRIALQCGGSDAFSGVSGNPLAGWLARELIRQGGSANMCETDELIGAEPYMLANVKDWQVAQTFVRCTEAFQQRAGWHGTSAEGNPSGGNMFRGLYNITIKSIGAARKKDPRVCLDYVIDFAERMADPGFYFMESPGNDLEGIAGQAAAGCALILFTTGNGSITNFPFVPTLKIMTNSGRFNLLARDMDINAGRLLDGVSLEELGRESMELMVRTASGEKAAGERGGHAQVQLWRNWRQSNAAMIDAWPARTLPTGKPLRGLRPPEPAALARISARHITLLGPESRPAFDRIRLILPTSLCASQVGRMIAESLDRTSRATGTLPRNGIRARHVALPHTEGCGVGGVENEAIQLRTLTGCLLHSSVERALVLEHGCEKTHHDAMRNHLSALGIETSRFGWASIQLDGGIESVARKVRQWFETGPAAEPLPVTREASLAELRVGLQSRGACPPALTRAFGWLAASVAAGGGNVVLAANDQLVSTPEFRDAAGGLPWPMAPTLDFAAACAAGGLHLMASPTEDPIEIQTALGATGVDLILAWGANVPLPAHPFIPVFQISACPGDNSNPLPEPVPAAKLDFDLVLDSVQAKSPEAAYEGIVKLLESATTEKRTPRMLQLGNTDFRISRGWFGFSL